MKEPAKTSFDDVLVSVCSFGKWQKFIYVSTCLLVIVPSCLQVIGLVFFAGTPKFHCVTPNVTCEDSKCCTNCTEYVFDGPFTSSVSEWNLICDRAYVGANVQAGFAVGMLVGSIVFGATSDVFGRRVCMYLCAALLAISSLGSSLVDCLSFFAFLRFLSAAFTVGFFVTHYVYLLELIGPAHRTMIDKIQSFFWCLGAALIALMGYFISDWRTLLLVSSFPPLLLFAIFKLLPESARWLAVHGQVTKAHAILMAYASKESLTIDSASLKTKLEEVKHSEEEANNNITDRLSFLDLVRTPRMRKRTFILAFNWLVVSLVYYGFLFYVTRLSGNPYFNVFLMYLSDVPTHLISWVVLQRFGRRIPHCLFMVTSGLILLLVLAIPKDAKGSITAMAFIGRFLASGSFSNIYLFTTELYPTSLRNQGCGICSTSARVGSIMAPYIVMLAQLPGLSDTLPMVIFGSLTMVAGLLSLFLPETLFCDLPETLDDVIQAPEFYGAIWLGKRRPCPIKCCRSDDDQPASTEVQLL